MPTRSVFKSLAGAVGLASILPAAFALGACTRALVPLGTTPLPLVPTSEAESVEPVEWAVPDGEVVYAVFGIAPGARLPVRQPAGISGTVVAELSGDLRAVQPTGQSTPLGSSNWVEIALPSGGTGWINLWNLTEEMDSDAFCRDPRVPALIDTFFAALRERSGEALARTISPRRGLVLRHDWWNPEIVIASAEVPGLMQRVDEVVWGTQRGSGAPIAGSFRDRWLPELDALLGATPEESCNRLLGGETTVAPAWPSEYARMNFLSYYLPAPNTSTKFSWRSWAVGIEYVDGVPYVAILIRYQGDL